MISDLQSLTAAHCVVGKTADDIGVIIGNTNAEEEVTKCFTNINSGEDTTKCNFHMLYKIEVNEIWFDNIHILFGQ